MKMEPVVTRKVRTTKTEVSLYDMGKDYPDGRWETVCGTHGNCVSHDKKVNALYYLSHPEDWCQDCQKL